MRWSEQSWATWVTRLLLALLMVLLFTVGRNTGNWWLIVPLYAVLVAAMYAVEYVVDGAQWLVLKGRPSSTEDK